MQVEENKNLAQFTTFGIGGSAKYYIVAHSIKDLRDALALARTQSLRVAIMGGGSNILVSDKGYDGIVIKIALDKQEVGTEHVDVEAGRTLLQAIISSSEAGMGGWEKMAGIPGTVGGAVRGNAGAFGSEIKDFLISVEAINIDTDEQKIFDLNECDMSYRHSYFKDNPQWIITSAKFKLVSVFPYDARQIIDNTMAEREKRHLQNVRAAGSFFMNPIAPKEICDMFEVDKGVHVRNGRVPAGWLIDKVGMRGARVGGSVCSAQHPNYLINADNATATDVITLSSNIVIAVKEKFGITLEPEATIL